MDTVVDTQAGSAGQKVPAVRRKVPVRFPIQLRIQIDPSMNNSLGRLSRFTKKAEGLIGREALNLYLQQNDPNYRQELLASLEGNKRNQG